MYDDTQELAENKLILLYVLNWLGRPVSNTQITEIVLENELLNYFNLQKYLAELVESGILECIRQERKQIYALSPKGRKVFTFFENRIPDDKKDILNKYLAVHKEFAE